MPTTCRRLLLVFASILALAGVPAGMIRSSDVAAQSGAAFYYQQITNISGSASGTVGLPVLSADGTLAVFADAPGSGDPATPNRVYRIAADGSGLAEVDSYTPKCFCGSLVDLSADGSIVVSTDSVQVRTTTGGNGTTILELTSNELSSLRLTAAGDRMVFIVGRDVAVAGTNETLVRGIYLLNFDGSGLTLLVGPDQLAPLAGTTVDQIGMLRLHPQALDISDDGSKIVFGAYIGGNQAVYSANIDGSGLVQLHAPVSYVQRVAISGDGASVAMDVIPVETQISEVSVVPFAGGPPSVLIPGLPTNQLEPIQLTQDGSKLLISPNALLVDTATSATTLLAVSIQGLGGTQAAVIPDGLPRATMDATASTVLYAIHTTKCADCANLSEQLAVLTFESPPPGAPTISNTSIDPTSATLGNYEETFTISADVSAPEGTLLAVGFGGILPDGQYDGNFGSTALLADDGTLGDTTAGDGTYAQTGIVYVVRTARDPGPRTIRIAAELETADGYRLATAVDAGVFELTAAAAVRSG